MDSNADTLLSAIVKRASSSTSLALNQDERSLLLSLFTSSTPSTARSKAYIALSAVCDNQRRIAGDGADKAANAISNFFLRDVQQRLSEVEETPLLEALTFVAALFTVDHKSASLLFSSDDFQDSVMDTLDLFPTSRSMSSAVSSLLSITLGHKACASIISSRCVSWLEETFKQSKDFRLKTSAALSLLKLSQSSNGASEIDIDQSELLKAMKATVIEHSGNITDIGEAVEGLTYLTSIPSLKGRIAGDIVLMKKLVSVHTLLNKIKLSEEGALGTLPYGFAAIVSNLCAYRQKLTEEQQQIQRLRRMAQPNNSKDSKAAGFGSKSEDAEDDETVRKRARSLVDIGVVDILVVVTKVSDSTLTRAMVSQAFLDIIDDKDNRGKVLQSGGAKALLSIIRASQVSKKLPGASSAETIVTEFNNLMAIQALAKLSITASPLQVFGPNDNLVIEAIKPFTFLLLSQSSNQLQRFESLMALTNISSASPEMADRVGKADGLLPKVKTFLLDQNTLIRRAATELVCNLVSGCEEAFNKFSGELSEGESQDLMDGRQNQAKQMLHVLIALADVDDEPTRLAASGSLAILTSSTTACRILMLLDIEHHRVIPILQDLIAPSTEDDTPENVENGASPNLGLLHRGVVCIRNLFLCLTDDDMKRVVAKEAEKQHVVSALTNIIKLSGQSGVSEAILRPTAEALKWLMDSGINIVDSVD